MHHSAVPNSPKLGAIHQGQDGQTSYKSHGEALFSGEKECNNAARNEIANFMKTPQAIEARHKGTHPV